MLSLLSIGLGLLLLFNPFGAAVSAVMLCGVLLIAEGAVNLGCVVYAAMELRALDRMADAAMTATLGALGDALDAEEEAEQAAAAGFAAAGPDEVVYDAESTEVPNDDKL